MESVMRIKLLLVMGLLLSPVIFAQTLQDSEIRAKFAESQLKVEQARLDVAKRTINELQQEIALKTVLFFKLKQESEKQAVADRAKISALNASLAIANENLLVE